MARVSPGSGVLRTSSAERDVSLDTPMNALAFERSES